MGGLDGMLYYTHRAGIGYEMLLKSFLEHFLLPQTFTCDAFIWRFYFLVVALGTTLLITANCLPKLNFIRS